MARRARRCRTVVVFMRAPVLGRVKSRLARDIGAVAAWQFYKRSSQRLVRRLEREPTWSVTIAWAEPPSASQNQRRPRNVWQGSGDIGRRMERCLRLAPPGPVVLLGADIPGVRAGHIRNAFRALQRAPLVFGPAGDGGFWLVGARNGRQLPRPLFGPGIRWSSAQTLRDVAERLRLPHALADTLDDVDYAADLPASDNLTGFPGR